MMFLITDELVQAMRTATLCHHNASARWAKNILSLYCCCRATIRAAPCIFVCVSCLGWLGQPVCILGFVTMTVSSSSALAVQTCGGGGVFHADWGLVGFWVDLPGFFGQPLDICPCCLQKKQWPSAMSCHFSSSLSGFLVLMASTSITFGSQEEDPPPCPHCPKQCCHWFLVPKFPWFPIDGWKERMAFFARYFCNSSLVACCHCVIVFGQVSLFMMALRVPGRSPEWKVSIVPSLLSSHPAFMARELKAMM
jgi:hypothetical protein